MRSGLPTSRQRRAGTPLALFAAVAVLGPLSVPAHAAEDWREILERSAERSRERAYEGEVLWVTYNDDRPYLTRASVRHAPAHGLVVGVEEGPTVHVDEAGGDVLHYAEGWSLALPDAAFDADGDGIGGLEEKYDVQVATTERLLDRRCTRIDIHRRADSSLRERLWIDDRSGLLLRRETHVDDDVVRMVSYLSLDLRPADQHVVPLDLEQSPLPERSHDVAAVDGDGLATLREAGWTVPEELTGGYKPAGAYAVSVGDSQPLQLVYGDGLYSVSVFQQEGEPDWASMPAGAERVSEVDGELYTWPGALPQRYLWSVDGRTWSVIGDAPPDDLRAILSELPQPSAPGFFERVGRGLGRLWSWVSPWE